MENILGSVWRKIVDKTIRLPMPWQLRDAVYQVTNLLSGARYFKSKAEDRVLFLSNQIKDDGYVVIDNIPEIDADTLFEDIKKFYTNEELIESSGINQKDGELAGITYAGFEDLIDIRGVIDFCEHPLLLGVADEYLGCKSKIAGISSWKTKFLRNKASNAQQFHRDIDALKWLKVFVYLTDVDDHNGPHVYVEKTHKLNRFISFRRIKDDEIVSSGLEEEHIKGLKGTVIVADSFGLHKGLAPKEGYRAILQVTYCRDRLFMMAYPKNSQLTGPRWKFFN